MIKSSERTLSRRMARYTVELYQQSTDSDSFGRPVDQYTFVGCVPASIEEISGSRGMQYQQMGIVGAMEVRIRKPEFAFDKMFIHPDDRSVEVGDTFTRGDLNGLQELTIHAIPNRDAIMIGDEMVITARRKDGK